MFKDAIVFETYDKSIMIDLLKTLKVVFIENEQILNLRSKTNQVNQNRSLENLFQQENVQREIISRDENEIIRNIMKALNLSYIIRKSNNDFHLDNLFYLKHIYNTILRTNSSQFLGERRNIMKENIDQKQKCVELEEQLEEFKSQVSRDEKTIKVLRNDLFIIEQENIAQNKNIVNLRDLSQQLKKDLENSFNEKIIIEENLQGLIDARDKNEYLQKQLEQIESLHDENLREIDELNQLHSSEKKKVLILKNQVKNEQEEKEYIKKQMQQLENDLKVLEQFFTDFKSSHTNCSEIIDKLAKEKLNLKIQKDKFEEEIKNLKQAPLIKRSENEWVERVCETDRLFESNLEQKELFYSTNLQKSKNPGEWESMVEEIESEEMKKIQEFVNSLIESNKLKVKELNDKILIFDKNEKLLAQENYNLKISIQKEKIKEFVKNEFRVERNKLKSQLVELQNKLIKQTKDLKDVIIINEKLKKENKVLFRDLIKFKEQKGDVNLNSKDEQMQIVLNENQNLKKTLENFDERLREADEKVQFYQKKFDQKILKKMEQNLERLKEENEELKSLARQETTTNSDNKDLMEELNKKNEAIDNLNELIMTQTEKIYSSAMEREKLVNLIKEQKNKLETKSKDFSDLNVLFKDQVRDRELYV